MELETETCSLFRLFILSLNCIQLVCTMCKLFSKLTNNFLLFTFMLCMYLSTGLGMGACGDSRCDPADTYDDDP